MKKSNNNTRISSHNSDKRFFRENGTSKSVKRDYSSTRRSKVKKNRERSKPASHSGSSILPPPPVPPKRMDKIDRDKNTSTRESSTSTYSTGTYSTSTYSSSSSTYSSCSSNSCTSHSGSESCSTCDDDPKEEQNSTSKFHPTHKTEGSSSIKVEKHPIKPTEPAQALTQSKSETANPNLPSTSGASCSLTARLRTVFLRHVNIPLNQVDPSLKDPRKRDKVELKEIMDLDLPRFALKLKLPKRVNPEGKQKLPRPLDLKKEVVSTSEDSVMGTPQTAIPSGGLIQKRELDCEGSRRNSNEERTMKNEFNKLSSTLRSLNKTSALFKEINDKIDARKTFLNLEKKPHEGEKEVNIKRMEQEVKQLLEMFSANSTSHCSSVSHLFGDFSHHHDVDIEASTSHTVENYRDKLNDHQKHPLHAISHEDSPSTERRNTLPSKTLTEASSVCTPKPQLQQKSCLAPISRQRASSSNSITHSTDECPSPFLKQNEISDFGIQSGQQKCIASTSIPKMKIEKDEIGNTSPQLFKKSSLMLKKTSANTSAIQSEQHQQNKTLTTTPKLKTEPKKVITTSPLFTPTLIDTSIKKLKDKDKIFEKKDQQKDIKIKQQSLAKTSSTLSTMNLPKKASTSKDEKYKETDEMRKPKAFSVGSKDQLKSISKKKGTSEIDSIADGNHLRKKKRHHIRKHKSSSGSSDSEGDSDTAASAILCDIDLEEQKRMLEAIKSGTNFGMSMYDRVKRRSSQRPDDERKKSQALEQLREKKTKKKMELNRVRLSSSSSDDSDTSKKDDKKSSPIIQDQQIKKEIEEQYESHSDIDENDELDVGQIDSIETEVKAQQDSEHKECHKTEVSSIRKPQIAPRKPAIMEKVEKEGWDGAFESKESSSSDEWSLSVSADEKTDNEDPGRIGDKIVQKLQAEFVKHQSSSPRSDGQKDDLDQKIESLINEAKEGQHQVNTTKFNSASSSSSSNSSISTSSSSSSESSDEEDVPSLPKNVSIDNKVVQKKTTKFSLVDVFGEDSDNQEDLNIDVKSVTQQPSLQHSKVEEIQKNKDGNDEKLNNEKVNVLTNKQPVLPKKESTLVEKKVIERKRKPSEQKTFSKFSQKKFIKKGMQKNLNENQTSELQNTKKKSKLVSSIPSKDVSESITENKEQSSEVQMVVIASGFVEIDARVLKEQEKDTFSTLEQTTPTIQQLEQISKDSEASSKLEKQQQSHQLNENITSFDNQEELDAIANINQSVGLKFECDKIQKNEERNNDDKNVKLSENQFSTSTLKSDETKNTSVVYDSAIQEELDAIANIKQTIGLKNDSVKEDKNDFITEVNTATESKKKSLNDEFIEDFTNQEELDAIENIKKPVELKDECDNNQYKNESIIEEKIIDRKRKLSEKESYDDDEDIQHIQNEKQVNESNDDATSAKKLKTSHNNNISIEMQMVGMASGFVEVDAEVLKEQQERESIIALQYQANQTPEKIVSVQVCDPQFSSHHNQKQNFVQSDFQNSDTIQIGINKLMQNEAQPQQMTAAQKASIVQQPQAVNPPLGSQAPHQNISQIQQNTQQSYPFIWHDQMNVKNADAVQIPKGCGNDKLLERMTSSSSQQHQHLDSTFDMFQIGIKQQQNETQQQNLHSISLTNQPINNNSNFTPMVSSAQNIHFNQQDIQKQTSGNYHIPFGQQQHQQLNTTQKSPIIHQQSTINTSHQQHLQPSQLSQQQHVQSQQISQQQQNIQHQQLSQQSQGPILWQGPVRNTDTLFQMHKVCGNDQILEQLASSSLKQQQPYLDNTSDTFHIGGVKKHQQNETSLHTQQHSSISLPNQQIHNSNFPSIISSNQNQQFNQQDTQKPSIVNYHKPQHLTNAQKAPPIVQQPQAVNPPLHQTQQQNIVQRQQNAHGNYPFIWHDHMNVKNADTAQIPKISGNDPLLERMTSGALQQQSQQQYIDRASDAFKIGIKQQHNDLQQQRHHSIPQVNQSIHNSQFPSIVSSTQNEHFNQQDLQKGFIDQHKPLQQINTTQKAPIVQQLPAVHPSQISQPQQQNLVQRQPNTQRSYPTVWQGQLAMKNADTLIQMHKVCGNEQLVQRMNHELVTINEQGIPLLRVTKRMRLEQSQLDNLMRKMEREENHVALICLPCGRDRNDVAIQTEKMAKAFIEYYSSKSAAGIVSSSQQGCVVAHIFPPTELSRTLLLKNAPEILKKVDFLGAGYLFVILTNS